MLNPWTQLGVEACGCLTASCSGVVLARCEGHDPVGAAERSLDAFRRSVVVAGRRRRLSRERLVARMRAEESARECAFEFESRPCRVDEVRVRDPDWRAPELDDPEVSP